MKMNSFQVISFVFLLTLYEFMADGVLIKKEIRPLCGPNQEFRVCGCEKTCDNLQAICVRPCLSACFCKHHYVKGPKGDCIPIESCPENITVSLMGPHELTVEDCGPDEEYLFCGWCEPTCSSLHPQCPPGVCTRGCLCRPPLVRHSSGNCVEPQQCLPQRCTSANEVYKCQYGCEPRCPGVPLNCIYQRSCQLGCHCMSGFVRHSSGDCVRPDQC